jgi:L-alanine-DL-glutamate epimerase-like enolase superfamily enzyme
MTAIASINTYPMTARLRRPLYTAHEPISVSNMVLVEVLTVDGIKGYGLINGSPLKGICDWVQKLGDLVIGMNALENTEIWNRLFALTSPRPDWVHGRDGLPRPFPRDARGQIMSAIGGIDLALWDIRGKSAGRPVFELLGGKRRTIYTYATGGYFREEGGLQAGVEELADFVAAGFKGVKLKVGFLSPSKEAKRVAAARELIGPETDLMLDLSAAYTLPECIDFASRVSECNVFWLEEPLHWYLRADDFSRLHQATGLPIAHGERALTGHELRDFVSANAVQYIQFDSTRYAGFTEAVRIAQYASLHGVKLVPHHAPELHGHLVAGFPDVGFGVESHGDHDRDPIARELYAASAELSPSGVVLNDRPGFGIEINWDCVRKYAA